MIEKFLEKFLPQITERVNENEEVGKALIEALAVLDNYATINNVQFTDEQVNAMLGIVPEPAPEPNADVPAEIVEIVEKKKRGRKPKASSNWTWRFKTKEELESEYGLEGFGITNFRNEWGIKGRDYLFGKAIPKTAETEAFIKEIITSNGQDADTKELFGIDSGSSDRSDNNWFFTNKMLTEQPLTTTAAPTTWNWRFKTEEEFVQEYGKDWYDNLVRYWVNDMNYLFGQKLEENLYTQELISSFKNDNQKSEYIEIKRLGLPNSSSDYWTISADMFTNNPLPTAATFSTWKWRIKTEQELIKEYGTDYKLEDWYSTGKDYLLGQPIIQKLESENYIQEYAIKNKKTYERSDLSTINTDEVLGITSGIDDYWIVSYEWLTDKPLPTAAKTTTWNWRFKTEEEFKEEYGDDWREDAQWSVHGGMDYLFGEEIAETSNSRGVINLLKRAKPENYDVINTFRELGISSGDDDDWILQIRMLTNDPLPTAAAPATQTTWNWRFKTEKEMQSDFGAEWREEWGIEERDFLFGKAIPETTATTDFIMNNVVNSKSGEMVNTKELFGIDSGNANENEQYLDYMMITNKPLSTIAAPAKRGRKPKASSNWNWRFKTLDEFVDQFGDDWVDTVDWAGNGEMDYLLGKEILQTPESIELIDTLENNGGSYTANTRKWFGITSGVVDLVNVNVLMFTNDPLPDTKKTPAKRGRKPKASSNWTWRFKTEEEFKEEYGDAWKESFPRFEPEMNYLLGRKIQKSTAAKEFIDENKTDRIDTEYVLGITSGRDDMWFISPLWLTEKPLPTTAAPAKRGRKPKSELPQIDLGGLEDIGDIDIDDIDFDNLVI
jgi:hypothetical protein